MWVPTVRADVLQADVLVLPDPVSPSKGEHPAIHWPPSVKSTFPVGSWPVTEAVKVTAPPTFDGFAELVRVVSVANGTPQEGNLNDPMRVCQLPLSPFAWLL
jgi:hypothetical protein